MEYPVMSRWQDNVPSGVVIDGAVYPLDGQPPKANQGSWGDIGWARWLKRLFGF